MTELLGPGVIYVVNWFQPVGLCRNGSPDTLGYGELAKCKDAFGKDDYGTACVAGCGGNNGAEVVLDLAVLQDLLAPALRIREELQLPVRLHEITVLQCTKFTPS